MPSVTVDPEDDTENSGTKARELTPLKIQEFDFSKLEIRPRNHNIDRHRSCEVKALFELSMASASPRHTLKNLDHLKITEHLENAYSPSWRSNVNSPKASISSHLQAEAWEALRRSLVHFRGRPVGTIAAMDPSEEALNYNQVFTSVNSVLFRIFFCLQTKICELLNLNWHSFLIFSCPGNI